MSENLIPTQKVIVVDFGAQYAQLIARRVRELNVYSEIVPHDIPIEDLEALKPGAIILSGGPQGIYADYAPKCNPAIFMLGVPVLGISYGMQVMATALKGTVPKTGRGEYGFVDLKRADVDSRLLSGTPDQQTVWMSHRDSVGWLPSGFTITSSTSTTPIASMEDAVRGLYAVQFHPEVHHTRYGNQILSNFLFGIADLERNWDLETYIERSVEAIRARVNNEKVILGLSGGVDSTVAAALMARAVGNQLTCILVDHGLMRENEIAQISEAFDQVSEMEHRLVVVDAVDRYMEALAGVVDPVDKREIIGEEFWKVFFEAASGIKGVGYLAQGTIYPDVLEAGSAVTSKYVSGGKDLHDLVIGPGGVPLGKIEPLRLLFKDEVRQLGVKLGLPEKIVYRQPFPGPGLAIRVIGDVTTAKLDILRHADRIVRKEIGAYNKRLFNETGIRDSEHSAWQYFALLLDNSCMSVDGEARVYERPIVVRAVESVDSMTADYAKLPYEVLTRIATRIVDEVEGVNRVVYDITSKPPASIEWE